MSVATDRRALVRRELLAGDVAGLRDLAARLADEGIDAEPDELRADIRALGAIRVERTDGSVLALPVEGDAPGRTAGSVPEKLAAEVSSDPDWKLQIGVAVVVAAFLLVAFLGWLIS